MARRVVIGRQSSAVELYRRLFRLAANKKGSSCHPVPYLKLKASKKTVTAGVVHLVECEALTHTLRHYYVLTFEST